MECEEFVNAFNTQCLAICMYLICAMFLFECAKCLKFVTHWWWCIIEDMLMVLVILLMILMNNDHEVQEDGDFFVCCVLLHKTHVIA